MTDKEAFQAYRRGIQKNEDEQINVEQRLKKLNEQEVGVEHFQANMCNLLQDIGYSWSLGENEASCYQAPYQELYDFEGTLSEATRQAYRAIADERERLERVLRKLEDKREDLTCEYKNKLTNK